jgi:hypothetical protein
MTARSIWLMLDGGTDRHRFPKLQAITLSHMRTLRVQT